MALSTTVAFGQASPSTQDAPLEANAAIERGIAARQRGDDDEALAHFRRAFALAPSTRAQTQIALAEQALGQWVAAERDLLAALQRASDPWIARNEAALRTALGQIQERLATLEVRTSTEQADVRINDESVGRATGSPFRVPSGTVTVEVRAEGYIAQRRTIEIAPRARLREAFNLVRAGASVEAQPVTEPARVATITPRPARPEATSPRASFPVGPVVVGGVGVAALALGGAFVALRGQALGACPLEVATNTLVCPTQTSFDSANAGRTWTTAANVALIGGAALTVGAGVWLAVSLATAPRNERSADRRLRVAPWVATSGGGLVIGGAL